MRVIDNFTSPCRPLSHATVMTPGPRRSLTSSRPINARMIIVCDADDRKVAGCWSRPEELLKGCL